MYIEDQAGDATVRVGDRAEGGGRAIGNEGLRRSPVVSREENELRSRTSISDSGDRSLNRFSPSIDIRYIMRLVHSIFVCLETRGIGWPADETHTPNRIRGSSLYLAAIFPQRVAKTSLLGPPWPIIYNSNKSAMLDEKLVGTTHFAIEASVVVNIDNATCTSGKAGLDEIVILLKVRIDDCSARQIAGKELPTNGKSKEVEAIVVNKVLHLTGPVHAVILRQRGPRCTFCAVTICVAAEVKTCYIDTVELKGAGARSGRSSGRRSLRGRRRRLTDRGRGRRRRCGCSRCSRRDALRIVFESTGERK